MRCQAYSEKERSFIVSDKGGCGITFSNMLNVLEVIVEETTCLLIFLTTYLPKPCVLLKSREYEFKWNQAWGYNGKLGY